MKIKDLQKEEKPREKLIDKGTEVLTDVELLAIILRSGGEKCTALDLARNLLKTYSSLSNLVNAETEQLTLTKNVGVAKATAIKALSELAKRISNIETLKGKRISKPKDIYDLIRNEIATKAEEHLYLISLNQQNKLISKDLLSKGTLNETLIHPREIFKKALAKNACYIVLAHNHPSGEINPSVDDIKVTRKISKTGYEIGVPLIDHVIVTPQGFSSMKAQHLLS